MAQSPVIVDDTSYLDPTAENFKQAFSDLETMGKQDVAIQKGEKKVPTADEAFVDFLNSTTPQEINEKGYNSLGDVVIDPEILAEARQDNALQAQLYEKFVQSYRVPEQEPGKLAVGFSTPDYAETNLPAYFNKYPEGIRKKLERVVDIDRSVADILSKSDLPLEGQELLLNDFVSGSLSREIMRTYRDIPSDISQTLPTLAGMAWDAGAAGLKTAYDGWDTDMSFGEYFSAYYGEYQKEANSPITTFLRDASNKSVVFRSGAQRLSAGYKEKFIEKYGEDGWKIAHQVPATELDVDESGQVIGLKQKYNEDGSIAYEDSVDLNTFESIIGNSFDQLTSGEKAAMFFSSNAPIVQFSTLMNVSRGDKWYRAVQAARTSNPDRFGSNLTDWQVHLKLVEDDYGKALTYAISGFNRITFGKGAMDRGKTLNAHLANLGEYQSKAAKLEDELSKLRIQSRDIGSDPSIPDQIKDIETELAFLEKSRSAYVNKSGNSKYLNPFSINAGLDDVAVALAAGYVPEYVGMAFNGMGFEPEIPEMLSMLTFPLVAPSAARGTVSLVSGASKYVPVIKTGREAITDLGVSLENSDWLSVVTPGMLIRGDTAEIRAAAAQVGMELDDETIKSMDFFSRLVRSAKTNVDIGGGKTVNMQLKIYDSLKSYNGVMTRMQSRMKNMRTEAGTRVFSNDEVRENMANLHLSLAHASGLAPLVAVQELQINKLKPGSLTNENSLNEVFQALLQEEVVYEGMNTNLKVLTESLAKKNIQLDSNEPLQQTIDMLSRASQDGLDRLNQKRQQAELALNTLITNPGAVTSEDLDMLTDMKILAMAPEARAVVDRAKVSEQVAVQILDSSTDKLLAAERLSSGLTDKQVRDAVSEGAETLFSTVLGARRSRGSARYTDVDTYAQENNIEINLDTIVGKMLSKDEELRGNEIDYFFKGGKQWLSAEGGILKQTFNSMARNGLIEYYGDEEEVLKIIKVAFENKQISSPTFTDYALWAAENAKEASPFRFFKASVMETEDIRRFFRDRRIGNLKQGNVTKAGLGAIEAEFLTAIDEVFDAADPSGQLTQKLEIARAGWKQDVGDVTETGTYGGTVTKGQKRVETIVDEKTGKISTGKIIYSSPSARPEKPLLDIAKDFRKLMNETDVSKKGELLVAIGQNRDYLMQFLGAERRNGQIVFNLSDPLQNKAAKKFEGLLETLLNKEGSDLLQGTFAGRQQEISQLPERLRQDIEMDPTSRLLGGELPDYDFSRANRMLEAERELLIPVVKDADSDIEYRKGHTAQLQKEFADVDTLLMENEQWRGSYNTLMKDANTADSTLRIASQREYEKDLDINKQLTELMKNAGDPTSFFTQNFATATPASIQDLRTKLTSQGMKAEDVDYALKNMYVRGLMELTGHRYVKTSALNDAREEISDLTVLIDHVNNPTKRRIMDEVLGTEHAQHMEDIAEWGIFASGNGAGFRALPDTKGMSIDSAIARFFNLSRGLVSPQYVATEVGLRVMLKRRQSLIKFALQDRTAAGILGKMMSNPKAITNKDINSLSLRVRTYILAGEGGILRTEGEIPALDVFLGITFDAEEGTMTITEKEAAALEEQRDILREEAEKLEEQPNDEQE